MRSVHVTRNFGVPPRARAYLNPTPFSADSAGPPAVYFVFAGNEQYDREHAITRGYLRPTFRSTRSQRTRSDRFLPLPPPRQTTIAHSACKRENRDNLHRVSVR